MKKHRLAIAAVAVSVTVSACAGGSSGTTLLSAPEPFTKGEILTVDLPLWSGEVAENDISNVTKRDRLFGFDLLSASGSDENLMISPYSIATALSMVYAGARGKTADEISSVLRLDVDEEVLHQARNLIESSLKEGDEEAFTVSPVNSVWGQGGYPFLEGYLSLLSSYYGAGLRLVDFANEADEAREMINDWVEEVTNDRIKDLIAPGVLNEMTRLVLVNAIWFKAAWEEPFEAEYTNPGEFTLSDGVKVSVPMMKGTKTAEYADSDSFVALRLSYEGDASMVIVLPKSGSLADFLNGNRGGLEEISWRRSSVDVTIPKFEFETDMGLKTLLSSMGMPTAFVPPVGAEGADFTGIVDVRELFISEVVHKTFVAVDEAGTEAAAATAVVFEDTSAPIVDDEAVFTADHPFLFWIEQDSTGEMLFLGQMVDPR